MRQCLDRLSRIEERNLDIPACMANIFLRHFHARALRSLMRDRVKQIGEKSCAEFPDLRAHESNYDFAVRNSQEPK